MPSPAPRSSSRRVANPSRCRLMSGLAREIQAGATEPRLQPCFGIYLLVSQRDGEGRVGRERSAMIGLETDERLVALRQYHAVNRHPQTIDDPLFLAGNAFFDARDLVQVKYEMIRQVGDGQSITRTALRFGFSRLALYHARASLEKGASWGSCPSGRGRGEHTGSPKTSSGSSSTRG
jgi:hypothetical protein